LNLAKIFAEVIILSIITKKLAEAVGKEISDSSLIQIFSNLLKDNEPDVKVVAV